MRTRDKEHLFFEMCRDERRACALRLSDAVAKAWKCGDWSAMTPYIKAGGATSDICVYIFLTDTLTALANTFGELLKEST